MVIFCLAIVIGRLVAPGRPDSTLIGVTATPSTISAPAEQQLSDVPVPVPQQTAATVALTIDATPRNALVQLDGELLPALPYTATVRADEQVHRLEASADGYRKQSLLVTFDRDRAINIVLPKDEVRGAPQSTTTK